MKRAGAGTVQKRIRSQNLNHNCVKMAQLHNTGKIGGKTVIAAYIKKALAKSWAIFRLKGLDCHSWTGFCLRTTYQVNTVTSVHESL